MCPIFITFRNKQNYFREIMCISEIIKSIIPDIKIIKTLKQIINESLHMSTDREGPLRLTNRNTTLLLQLKYKIEKTQNITSDVSKSRKYYEMS